MMSVRIQVHVFLLVWSLAGLYQASFTKCQGQKGRLHGHAKAVGILAYVFCPQAAVALTLTNPFCLCVRLRHILTYTACCRDMHQSDRTLKTSIPGGCTTGYMCVHHCLWQTSAESGASILHKALVL